MRFAMSASRQVDIMLRNARAALAEAGDNAHLLGHTLSQFHSAVEEHFRASLEENSKVPASVRISLRNPKETDRIRLLELMIQYGELSDADAQAIRHYNRIRNRIQKQNEIFQGTRQEVQQYAARVERIISGDFPQTSIPDEFFEVMRSSLDQVTSQKPIPPQSSPPTSPPPQSTTPRPSPPRPIAPQPTIPSEYPSVSSNIRRRAVRQPHQWERAPIGDWFMYALIGLLILGVIWRLLT
jgi:hypothetical protein